MARKSASQRHASASNEMASSRLRSISKLAEPAAAHAAAAAAAEAEGVRAPRRSVLVYLWSEGWLPSIISILVLLGAACWGARGGGADNHPIAPAAKTLHALVACPGRQMPDTASLYALLGVPRAVDDNAALRTAYRRLSRDWHPDKNGGCSAAPAVFAEVARAYKVLSTPELRDVYDRLGDAGLQRMQDGDPSVAKDWLPPEEALRRHGYSAETLQRKWRSLDDFVTNMFALLAGVS